MKGKIVKLLKKHTRELAMLLLGVAIFFVGLWQLDLIAARYVWENKEIIEVLPFWYMYNTEAYVLFFSFIFVGYVLTVVGLWLWED